MVRISIKRVPMTVEQTLQTMKEHSILTNRYAEKYISHPCYSARESGEMTVAIISLKELGLEKGASLDELFRHIKGTHSSPNQAVTVLSEILERDDAFPKGLYLRKVDGNRWLRGYVCDSVYRFPGDALFALEMCRV